MPSSKAIPNSILVLRIFTLLSLVGSGVLLVLDNFTLEDGTETHFYDILSFRFMLSTAAIGAAYTLFQLPFGIYYALTEKRLIRNECMPQFDFYGDKHQAAFQSQSWMKHNPRIVASLTRQLLLLEFCCLEPFVCLSFQCFLPSLELPTEVTSENNNLIFINFPTILIK
ncbi:CASP-like protein 4D1 isoform X2 [Malus sylvestris]|uniref:CASP-like protein 4D1 isoform X2 n=1 Tax=Malus sylvestris TaxID=3752 RepID=UPI0021AC1AFF|nr:CASP-like protein 4D1 isoform X2 [Malus sylvestris]